MQPRADSVALTAGNLLLSGMNGQMRTGDTLGVWTFNDSLHAGGFQLQRWSPENSNLIAERVALFVARQKFENQPNLDKVLPAMGGIISNSAFITVVLLTGGTETMRGTPYDRAINTIHKQWQRQQDKALMPFVTVLRTQRGRIVDFKVNTPPTTMEMPALPLELQIADAPPPKPAEVKPAEIPQPAPEVPSLIVHGKKNGVESESESNPATTNTEIQSSATTQTTNQNVAGKTSVTVLTQPTVATATNTGAVPKNAGTTNLAPAITDQVVSSTATETSARGKAFWFVGAAAVVAGSGLVFLLIRRSRSEPHTSLITRSLDRDKK
jgi:hypothetical protein